MSSQKQTCPECGASVSITSKGKWRKHSVCGVAANSVCFMSGRVVGAPVGPVDPDLNDLPLPNVVFPSSRHRFYGIESDYESTDCSGDCDSICRCSRIINTRIVRIEDWWELVSVFCPGVTTVFDRFVAERLLRRVLDKDNFYLETCNGYYGEETNGVHFDGGVSSSQEDTVRRFNLLKTRTERVEFLLNLEYGRLLPEVRKVEQWEVREVPLDSIDAFEGHMQHVDSGTVREYSESLPEVIAICLPRGNGRWRLIDGRHRFTAAVRTLGEQAYIKVLVPKQMGDQDEEVNRLDELVQKLRALDYDHRICFVTDLMSALEGEHWEKGENPALDTIFETLVQNLL